MENEIAILDTQTKITYKARLCYQFNRGYFLSFYNYIDNDILFYAINIKNIDNFCKKIINYSYYYRGAWPWCKTKDDVESLLNAIIEKSNYRLKPIFGISEINETDNESLWTD